MPRSCRDPGTCHIPFSSPAGDHSSSRPTPTALPLRRSVALWPHLLVTCSCHSTSCFLAWKDPGMDSWRFQTPFVSLCLLQGTGVLILARAVIRVFRGAVSWLQAVKHAGAGANRQAELGQASALCQIREEEMSDSSSRVCLKC